MCRRPGPRAPARASVPSFGGCETGDHRLSLRMAKKRVHEIAKERGITSKEALEVLRSAGLDVKVAASSVEEAEAARAFGNGAAAAPSKGKASDAKAVKPADGAGAKGAKGAKTKADAKAEAKPDPTAEAEAAPAAEGKPAGAEPADGQGGGASRRPPATPRHPPARG